jgi:hypothetical protein
MDKEISFQDRHNYCIAWEQSGKSRLAFCRANGIAPSTFQGWYHQYRTQRSSEMLFSPMVPNPSVPIIKESHDVQCEIRFPNETQLFITLQESALVSIIQGICHAATAIR